MKNLIAAIPDEYLKTIFWKSPNPMGITTARDGIYLDVNEAFTKIFGVRKQDLIGKSSVELGHLSKERMLEVSNEIKEKGYARNILVKNTDKNIEVQYLYINTTTIKVKNNMHSHNIVSMH